MLFEKCRILFNHVRSGTVRWPEPFSRLVSFFACALPAVALHASELPPGAIATLGASQTEKSVSGVGVTFISDDRLVVSNCGGGREIALWNVPSHSLVGEPLEVEGRVQPETIGSSGRFICKNGSRGWSLWNFRSRKRLTSYKVNQFQELVAAFLTPDGKTLVACTINTKPTKGVYAIESLEMPAGISVGSRHDPKLYFSTAYDVGSQLDFVDASEMFVVCTTSGLKLCETKTLRTVRSSRHVAWQVHASPISNVVATFDGGTGNICLYDLELDLVLWQHQFDRSRPTGPSARKLSFSSDGHLLAYVAPDGTLRVYDSLTGSEVFVGDYSSQLATVAFAPSGRLIATGATDNCAIVWSVEDMLELGNEEERLTDMDVQSLVEDLDALSARRAIKAVFVLSKHASQALPHLSDVARPSPKEEASALIEKLDDENFQERRAARRGLTQLGLRSLPAIRRALQSEPSPETRLGLELVLKQFRETPEKIAVAPNLRRAMRAIQLLERVNSAKSHNVLARIASGDPNAVETVYARNAIQRLARLNSVDSNAKKKRYTTHEVTNP